MARYEMLLRIIPDSGPVSEEVWWEARSEKGYECSHAYWSEDEYTERIEDMAFEAALHGNAPGPAFCEWCDSKSLRSTLLPCEVIPCPACDELVGAGDAFADHLKECGS